ncbi:MAG TPA: M24 family metallopeptidase, partial [Gemmatimonadaceae bacterium]|nr:M24 family metallopeptidase [Gemmatimonadaceae bacterium]
QLASHQRAAAIIAGIAREAMKIAGERARTEAPIGEFELKQWILDEFAKAKLEAPDHGPIVAIGPNAANPHYEPGADTSAPIQRGAILLIDLWAREPDGVYADQTWMGSLGDPSARNREIWEAIRDARDAAISLLRARIGAGTPVRGGEVDDAARAVITDRGFGAEFTHRTGHSIDPRDLHGSGPHIDNLETREERALLPGVGFSIEPGIYVRGEVGMRAEVNAFVGKDLVVTPDEVQRDLIIV